MALRHLKNALLFPCALQWWSWWCWLYPVLVPSLSWWPLSFQGAQSALTAICLFNLMCRKVGLYLLLCRLSKHTEFAQFQGSFSRPKCMEKQGTGGYWTHSNEKWLPDMGEAESPVRKTFFHRYLWVAAGTKMGYWMTRTFGMIRERLGIKL